MKFSIVTISYNQAPFLRACIDSVLSQRYPDVEYIVVDPGSTDGSREIIESYGAKIIRVFEPDRGAADGLNRGFQSASGDLFGFLNSDDELLPGSLAHVNNAFSTGRPDVVSGGGYLTDESGVAYRRVVPSHFTPWLYVYGAVSVFQQGTFFRSEVFKSVGGFNPDNRTCWDGELFLDMALSGARFHIISQQLANFRIHGGSISGSGRLNDAYRLENERLFEKVMRRKRHGFDRFAGAFARVLKPVLDPTYVWRRGFSSKLVPRGVTGD